MNVLKRFGHDSGLLRIQFDLTILETIPDIDSSSCDLHGPSDNQLKARWIQKMVIVYYTRSELASLTHSFYVCMKHH